jgi:hypothetical protein
MSSFPANAFAFLWRDCMIENMKFCVVKLDKQKLGVLKDEWLGLIEDADALGLECGSSFQVASDSLDKESSGAPVFYVLQNRQTGESHALLEMVHGTKDRRSLTKLLRLDLSPRYWFDRDEVAEAEVFTEAVILTITSALNIDAGDQKAGGVTVKIYGRDQQILDILLKAYSQLEGRQYDNFKCLMEGRWLNVSTKKV